MSYIVTNKLNKNETYLMETALVTPNTQDVKGGTLFVLESVWEVSGKLKLCEIAENGNQNIFGIYTNSKSTPCEALRCTTDFMSEGQHKWINTAYIVSPSRIQLLFERMDTLKMFHAENVLLAFPGKIELFSLAEESITTVSIPPESGVIYNEDLKFIAVSDQF